MIKCSSQWLLKLCHLMLGCGPLLKSVKIMRTLNYSSICCRTYEDLLVLSHSFKLFYRLSFELNC